VEHYHAYTGQFIIGAVFKKGTRRDPDSFLGLLSGPMHGTSAELANNKQVQVAYLGI
jgi:hypothetical protein